MWRLACDYSLFQRRIDKGGKVPAFRRLPTRMNKFLVTATAAALAGALPQTSSASPLDDALHCKQSAHTFISGLIDAGQIEPQPTRVESNSINAFDLVKGADLHAFGYPVFAIVGYEEGD